MGSNTSRTFDLSYTSHQQSLPNSGVCFHKSVIHRVRSTCSTLKLVLSFLLKTLRDEPVQTLFYLNQDLYLQGPPRIVLKQFKVGSSTRYEPFDSHVLKHLGELQTTCQFLLCLLHDSFRREVLEILF
mmetsp:Transcript_23183/g.37056  ORF Transcript_23183/g.37056 Transcript_23183/m.37056 type:complete len:128 (-) Transcript_23183:184-567(-)